MDAVDDTAATLGQGPGDSAESSSASCLAVLLDLHSEGWLQHSQCPLWTVLKNLLVLINAHIALDSGNELLIIGYNGLGASVLYSTAFPTEANNERVASSSSSIKVGGAMIRQFQNVDEAVLAKVEEQLKRAAETKTTKTTSVAGPLSLALTHLNRHLRISPKLRGHILVVSAEPEHVGAKYIPAMNSIFTAQKLRIPLDVANFGPPKSFLQQAADFTGGSYLELGSVTEGLVAIFMSSFVMSPAVRNYVNLPTKPDVDFSAVCFLTKNVVEIGYVCSVCLCIMEKVPADHRCPVCGTVYDRQPSIQN